MSGESCPCVEHLILDQSFIEFTLGTNYESVLAWEHFIDSHLECLGRIDEAKRIILAIEIKGHKEISASDIEKIISKVQSNYKRKEANVQHIKSKSGIILLRYAAILFIILSLGYAIYHLPLKKANENNSIVSTNYKQYTNSGSTSVLIKLSDNSTVILQPKGSLSYPVRFEPNYRKVYLSGNAFFEIKKNKAAPFYVTSKTINIKVTGTSFMVTEDNSTGNSSVSVSTGRVEVTSSKKLGLRRSSPLSLVLVENERATWTSKTEKFNKARVESPLPLSLQASSKNLNFVSVPFSAVITELEKAYNITIDYNVQVMGACLLTASLVDQSIDERLNLICRAVEAQYRYENGKVIITGWGCKQNESTN
ncbi:FecR family protein [Pedobacter agri]|uniref:FecR family protein n=1 Tax=Pedobacter agri TaxID=454586 RepID=UPI00293179FA|nr:FecR family protein [Pedobacter agri]